MMEISVNTKNKTLRIWQNMSFSYLSKFVKEHNMQDYIIVVSETDKKVGKTEVQTR